jgi:sugar phosphate isomerase/epimerase
MKLGLSTYAYTWSIGAVGYPLAAPMTALDLLQEAAGLGVRLVQMADNLPLDGLSPAELDSFQARAQHLGIAVEVGTRGIAPAHLQRCLALAQRFASPILRVVIDTPSHHPAVEEVIATLAPLQAEFAAAGVCLAIENHDRFAAPVLAALVRRLGTDWVGVCLDTVNSFGALEGPRVVVETLGPLTVNLHVKDFTIQRASHSMGFSIAGAPAGAGRLDVPWLLATLRDFGRDCNAILEQWTPPEPELAATIAREQQWAAQSVAYLRDLIPA